MLEVGSTVGGKFRIERILGEGGMGVVAVATHLQLEQQVALKIVHDTMADDAEVVERFMREARASARLRSEHVCKVSDVGQLDNGAPYIVMELLDGCDLQAVIADGPLPIAVAVEYVLQACVAVAEAHALGIVHRDLKPANLFLTKRLDGTPLIKVLDFGISKSPIVNAMQLTQTQSLLGTPAYMSPEQMRSARMVDSRTDIWSLGTVLYELLEGHRPFEAESFSEMCVKVAVDPPSPMTNAPADLQEVVLRCLAKTPEHRYASMAELAHDLVPFSHDPHQAQVLVERMSRMLRRSQSIDWDPARNSMPIPVREVRSAERQAVAADPVLPVARVSRISAAEPVPSNTYVVPPRKRRRALLVAVALAGAAALGVAISLTREPATSRPTSPPTNVVLPAKLPTGPAALDSVRSTGSAADVFDQAHPPSDSPKLDKPATGPGKPGNVATTKPDKGPLAPKGVPPAKPACEVDVFGTPHASNECPSGN
jgi:serine/threonine-protein kinase